MGEIINLQLGQCGNTIGDHFWSLLRDEHCLDNKGQLKANSPAAVTQNIRSYYYEFKENYFAPRALLVDLEPDPIEAIQAKGQVSYNPNNYIFGQSGAGYNWAKGHYTEGAELVDQVLDVVRAEVERADCIQGFQILHSISGGTGSGMGTLIVSKLREEFPDRMLWTFSHVGTGRVQDSIATVYNNVLALHQLIENTDAVVYLDDEVAYSLSYKHKILNPTRNHLNSLWASVLSDITSGMRFPTQSRLDLRKLACNLVPFPRTHFLVPSRSPISTKTFENNKDTTNIRDITTGLFDARNLLLDQVGSGSGRKHLSASCIFRGDIPIGEIDEAIAQMQNKNSSLFCEWIPDNLKTSLCSISPINLNMSGAALINTTAIIDTFNVTLQKFGAMFKRKAFLHWYLGEGMDEMEFTEAQSNLEDLTHEYQMYQDATIDRNFSYNSDDEVE